MSALASNPIPVNDFPPLLRYQRENGYEVGQVTALRGGERTRKDLEAGLPVGAKHRYSPEQWQEMVRTRDEAFRQGFDSVTKFVITQFSKKQADDAARSLKANGHSVLKIEKAKGKYGYVFMVHGATAKRELPYGAKVENPVANPKAVEDMSAAEINKRLDKLDEKDSALTKEFIAAGRGHERPSDFYRASDPLSRKYQALQAQINELRNEVTRRAGPGMYRLPKGFGPMRHRNPAIDDHTRTVLRLKQDFLLMLCDMAGYDPSLAIVEGGPKISQLRSTIHPEWEYAIDYQIRELSELKNVGVPNSDALANKKKNGGKMHNPEIDSTDLAEIMSAAFQNGVEVGQQLSSTIEPDEWDDDCDDCEDIAVEENPARCNPEYFTKESAARSFAKSIIRKGGFASVLTRPDAKVDGKRIWIVGYTLPEKRKRNGKQRNSIFLAPSVLQSMGQSGLGQLLTRANPTGNEFLNGQALGIRDAREKKSNWGVALRSTYGNSADPKAVADFRAGYARGQKIGKTDARRNPETDAAALYEQFHGKSSEQVTEYTYSEHEHTTLAQLGELVSLTVVTTTGYEVKIGAPPADGNITDVIQLCSSEDGRQLYFVGGNQSIDTVALGFKPKDEKDLMLLGVLTMVEYQTEKGFHNFQLTDYYHQLGEESGVQPVLLYDPISQLIKVAGGQYHVKPEGIVN